MRLYKESFGVYDLSFLAKCVFEQGYGLKKSFYLLKIESLSDAVIVNFDLVDEWWDIYLIYKTVNYKKYGYQPKERRFSYNEKPIGIISELREKLIALERSLNPEPPNAVKEKTVRKSANNPTAPQGCLVLFVAVLLIAWLFFKLT